MKVLIVEDEAIPARDLADIILRLGYQVVGIAADYTSAIDFAQRSCPDIALLDIRLQGEKDGLDVAQFLRDKFEIPIVFLTSLSDRETVARARDLKANGFVLKPFTENVVFAAVETAFGNFICETVTEEPASTGAEHIGGLAPHLERRLRAHIEDHLEADLSLDELSGLADMSRFHFAAMFRQSFGESPHRYVVQRRIERASRLLRETSQPIIEIGQRVGYDNQSYFTTLFRRETGATPAAYRKRFGS
ncbi:MAG: response regulator transcription factor [Myxococcota bacterium]